MKDVKDKVAELDRLIAECDRCMATELTNDINGLLEHLTKSCTLLSLQGRIMELAVHIFDWAKGQAKDRVDKDLKLELMRYALAGILSPYSAKYERAERTVKSFQTYIDGLRTIISAEKDLAKI